MAISSMAKFPNSGFDAKPLKVRREQLVGRRCFISFSAFVAASLPDSRKVLLREYLERSEKNKAKYEKERLEDYYKRNYEGYFDLVEGSIEGKKEDLLTDSEKGIRQWLRKNK